MLAEFGSDLVGHELQVVNIRRFASMHRRMPTLVRIPSHLNGTIAHANADFYNLLELSSSLLLLVQVASLLVEGLGADWRTIGM
jgi:hypothetical protein